MLIRAAAEADLPGILAIYNAAVRDTTAIYTEQEATLAERAAWRDARLALGYPVLVAADGDTVLGYGGYGDFRPYPGYRHTVEHSVYVDAVARGQGIGRALVTALVEHATALGKHVMVGAIDAANPPSIRLHASLGFVETGRMPEVGTKFGRWLDLVLMQRRLAA